MAVTVAVKVTLLPNVVLLEEAAIEVVVAVSVAVTVTVMGFEIEAAKFGTPPYAAEIELLPVGRVERLIAATPLLFSVTVPKEDPLFRKLTTPPVT